MLSKSSITLLECPFRHFVVDNFLDSDDYLLIKKASRDKQYIQRNSDLFRFQQSKELQQDPNSVYGTLRGRYFSDEFIANLENVSGRQLEKRFDTSFQKYAYGDYLLPHDDLLENRAFAYVLYLVDESWSDKSGGSLALLDCDAHLCPRNVVKRVNPAPNRLVVFEVSRISFHYVEEILDQNYLRFSLTGWFYFREPLNVFALEGKLTFADITSFIGKHLLLSLKHFEAAVFCEEQVVPFDSLVEFLQSVGGAHAKYLKKASIFKFTRESFLVDSKSWKHDAQIICLESPSSCERIKSRIDCSFELFQSGSADVSIIPSHKEGSDILLILLYF